MVNDEGETIIHSIAKAGQFILVWNNNNNDENDDLDIQLGCQLLDSILNQCNIENKLDIPLLLSTPTLIGKKTPFHLAFNDVLATAWLTTLPGADKAVLLCDQHGDTALNLCIPVSPTFRNPLSKRLDIITSLVKCGGNDIILQPDHDGFSILDRILVEVNLSAYHLVKIILTNTSGDPNIILQSPGLFTPTPLHLAVFLKHDLHVIALLSANQGGLKALFTPSLNGFTPIHIATLTISNNNEVDFNIIEFLLSLMEGDDSKDILLQDDFGFTPIHYLANRLRLKQFNPLTSLSSTNSTLLNIIPGRFIFQDVNMESHQYVLHAEYLQRK
jgi:ankyrin repeat protein